MRRLVKRFWGTLFTLVIALAVIVQMGREAFPLLNDYRDDISRLLGERLGVSIHIGQLSATWAGLRPKVVFNDVAIDSLNQEPIFRIHRALMELSLLESLVHRQLTWRQLVFEELDTTVQQQPDGPWRIKYLKTTAKSGQRFRIEDPLDIFLVGRRVEIKNARFALEFRTGHRSSIEIPDIVLENDRDFHRIQASAAVDGREHFKLITEGIGDPRDPDNFDAVGYVELDQFPMEQVLAAFAGDWWEEQDPQEWAEGHRLDMQLWYRGTSSRGITLRGKLRADGLPLAVPENVSLPEGAHADITGSWTPEHGWLVTLQQLIIDWQQGASPPIDLELRAGVGAPIGARVASLDIGAWHELLSSTGSLVGKAGEVLDKLEPRGTLKNIDVIATDKSSGYFQLRANLEAVQVQSFRGAPALINVNGFVAATANSGYVNLESNNGFEMNFPELYDAPFKFDRATGQVAWKIDLNSKTAYISSSRLHVEQGAERSDGYLHLDLPLVDDPREPKMTLVIGMEKGPVSLHNKYVPRVIPHSLYDWLGNSIGDGTATDLAFIYHGSVSKQAAVSPNLQLYANVFNGDLAFDKHWPPLKAVNGRLILDHHKLDVHVNSASLLGNRVNNAEVLLIPNPEDEGVALAIKGEITSNAGAAMALLQNSPVRSVFGSTFDTWKFDGDVSALIELQVPLNDNARGNQQLVNVTFDKAKVDMADIGLAVEQVQGSLKYSSKTGLSSPGLRGKVWGKPVKANISSPLLAGEPPQGRRDTLIKFTGPVAVDDVRRWTQRPELGFVEGSSVVDGVLTIPARDSTDHYLEIEIASRLEGVTLNLPVPMEKSATQERDFKVDLKLFDDYQSYRFDYNNEVSLRLRTGQDDSAQLNFGDSELPLQPGFFDILGRVSHGDLLEWDEVRDKYFEFLAQLQKGDSEEDELPIRVNLDIGRASVADIGVDNVHVNGLGTEAQWELRVESEPVAGKIVILAAEDSPVVMDLDYLHLPDVDSLDPALQERSDSPTVAESPPQHSAMADVDITTLVAVDFSVTELTVGDEPYGRWQFKIRPIEDGVAIRDVHALVRGMALGEAVTVAAHPAAEETIRKKPSYSKFGQRGEIRVKQPAHEALMQELLKDPHAEFTWRQTPEGNFSSFKGTLMARDAGSLLESWGQEKIVESELGVIDAEVSWPGAPDEINLQNVSGKVVFNFIDGSFKRGATEGDNGLLRLIALFNFDTIVRRLKLDFSDLAKEGFGFETVHGNFDFQNGWIYINDPLVVNSTSSKIQVAGTVDMIDEKIDAELVATLPVAGDITVATALIAGLPAAVGVFLVSKMFESQVDKASSLNYRISGDWEDPKIKFRKIFDDTAAKKKGEEVESMERDESRAQLRPENAGGDELDSKATSTVPDLANPAPNQPPIKYD